MRLILESTPKSGSVGALWAQAFHGCVIRHPTEGALVEVTINGNQEPVLAMIVRNGRCTRKGEVQPELLISCVILTYYPGAEVCRAWLAAAWAGLALHEALERVSYKGSNPLDPHAEPYVTNPYNRGLRDGLPVRLTSETLIKALSVVMNESEARLLVLNAEV